MAAAIRQFMTFEDLLRRDKNAPQHPRIGDFRRPPDGGLIANDQGPWPIEAYREPPAVEGGAGKKTG